MLAPFWNIWPEKLKCKHGAKALKLNGYKEFVCPLSLWRKDQAYLISYFQKSDLIEVSFLFSNSVHKIQRIILLLLLAVRFQRICLSKCHSEEYLKESLKYINYRVPWLPLNFQVSKCCVTDLGWHLFLLNTFKNANIETENSLQREIELFWKTDFECNLIQKEAYLEKMKSKNVNTCILPETMPSFWQQHW